MRRVERCARLWLLFLTAALLVGMCCPPANAIKLGDILDKVPSIPAVNKDKNNDDSKAKQASNDKTSPDADPKLSTWTGPKKRLGVMDMEVKITTTQSVQPTQGGGYNSTTTTTLTIPPPADFGTGLTEMMTTSLMDSGRFILLERKALGDIQAEQALAAGGSVDPSTASTSGKLLGAQALIRGAVTEYSYRSSSTGGTASFLKGVSLAATTSEAVVGLDIRIYDVSTGQILDSVKAYGKAKSSAAAIDVTKEDWKVGGNSFKQSPLGEATRQAITQAVVEICKRMDVIPWEGRVAEIDAGTPPTLYLNAGTQTGMKQGMQLEIVHLGKAIKDPDTGTTIGRTKDTYVGACEIKQCMDKISLAEPIDGQGFQVGDAVHMLNWKGPVSHDAQPAPAATTPDAGAPQAPPAAPAQTQPAASSTP